MNVRYSPILQICFVAILSCGCAHIRYPIERYKVIAYLPRIHKGIYLPLQFPLYFYPFDTTYTSYVFSDGSRLYIHAGDKNLYWTAGAKVILGDTNTAVVLRSRGRYFYIFDIDKGKLTYRLPMYVKDVNLWSYDTLIVLGLHEGKIFHLVPLYPELDSVRYKCGEIHYHRIIKSFGEYPEPVIHSLMPMRFALSDNRDIFVPSINAYKIYHYRGDTLVDTIVHPDVNRIPPPEYLEDTARVIVYNLGAIDGIAYYDDKLFISGYRHSSMDWRTCKTTFWVDVYDFKHKKWSNIIRDTLPTYVLYSDKKGVYVLHAGRVERWR